MRINKISLARIIGFWTPGICARGAAWIRRDVRSRRVAPKRPELFCASRTVKIHDIFFLPDEMQLARPIALSIYLSISLPKTRNLNVSSERCRQGTECSVAPRRRSGTSVAAICLGGGRAGDPPRKRGHFQNMAAPVGPNAMAFARSKQTMRPVKPAGPRGPAQVADFFARRSRARINDAVSI